MWHRTSDYYKYIFACSHIRQPWTPGDPQEISWAFERNVYTQDFYISTNYIDFTYRVHIGQIEYLFFLSGNLLWMYF